jgi:hypothetical protein
VAILETSTDQVRQCSGPHWRRDRHVQILLLVFFLTLPLVNPWVRGDGVGYYAYIRSLLVEHRFDFANDWRSANESFVMGRVRPDGSINPQQYTATGHLDNHFSVGPSMLWTPFLAPVHGVILLLERLGVHARADGYSRPYVLTLALATALYGFAGLLISFQLASTYAGERCAFWATLGIWFGSSLPVYMYFNPAWSHAHSVFVVAVFLWYWQRTRGHRTLLQWVVLGLWSGLTIDTYYLNIVVLLIPFWEALLQYREDWRKPQRDWAAMGKLFSANIGYCCAVVLGFLPTLITRKIVYGSPLDLGYGSEWTVKAALLQVLFSSDHGLLTWTPVLIVSIAGLFLLLEHDRNLAQWLLISCLAFYLVVSLHTNWDGLSSFGNRFFISLTPFFILGLAIAFRKFADIVKKERRALLITKSFVGVIVLWNAAFMFQWGTHLVPPRGPISWQQMIRNQFVVVPQRATSELSAYFHDRRALMLRIEEEDVRQLKGPGPQSPTQR